MSLTTQIVAEPEAVSALEMQSRVTEASRAVIRDYLASVSLGPGARIERFFAEDATWTLHGDLPMSGVWRGRRAILEEFMPTAFARVDVASLKLEVVDMIAEGERVVLEWTSQADVRGGLRYDQHCLGVFTVRDGLIVSVREYFDTEHARHTLFAA
ncbi:nuclear transport factor 2 family protein [Streptacidiphilus rugosus]|uniref:nuclear transport factor 2 family protein n=1 Tax=Streptacidiphilus rugosus TaxID=405783 RepID=UPI000A505142|nr:nuclear transport factor 2 family protein [Streptacidiphilus rugosus]